MKNMKIVGKSCTFPISCICYPNSEEILIKSLENLQKDMPNVEFCYIFHYGENGDKDHYHLVLRNNSTNGFRSVPCLYRYFMQENLDDIYVNDILKYAKGEQVCYIANRQFVVTNSLGDWYKYVLHNEDYLKTKNG